MRYWPVLFLLLTTPAHAAVDPRLAQCDRVEQQYGREMFEFRELLDKNSTDRGGAVDASFIADINFALAAGKDFVHSNIQFVQRAGARGGEPSVQACKTVTAMARSQIEQYARHLLSDLDPQDKRSREEYRDELRFGLYQSTEEFQAY